MADITESDFTTELLDWIEDEFPAEDMGSEAGLLAENPSLDEWPDDIRELKF